MSFSLDNFQKKEILSDVLIVDGEETPSTIEGYAKATKLPRLNVYLTSQKEKAQCDENEELDDSSDANFDDNTPLMDSIFATN